MRQTPRLERVAALAMLAFLSSCGGDGSVVTPTAPDVPDPPQPTTVTLAVPATELVFAETMTVTVTVLDQDGGSMTGQAVTWTTSNEGVLSVADGVVTAESEGVATLTATVGSASDQADITVVAVVHELTPRNSEVPAYHILTFDLPDGVLAPDTTVVAGWIDEVDLDVAFVSEGDTALSTMVPDLAAGTYTLWAVLDERGRYATLSYNTTPAPVIADPEAAVEEATAPVQAAVDSIMAAAIASGDAGLQAEATSVQALLDDAVTLLQNATAEEKILVAQMMASMPEVFGGDLSSAAAPGDLQPIDMAEWNARFLLYPVAVARVVLAVKVTAVGWAICAALTAAPTFGAGLIACSAVAYLGVAVILVRVHALLNEMSDLLATSIDPFDEMLLNFTSQGEALMAPSAATTTDESVSFVERTPRTLPFQRNYRSLTEERIGTAPEPYASFLTAVHETQSMWNRIQSFAETLGNPNASPPGEEPAFPETPSEEIRDVPIEEISFLGVTEGEVTCESSVVDGQIALTCATEAAGAQSFTASFQHNNAFEPYPFTITGTLQPVDMQIEVVSGSGQVGYPSEQLEDPLRVRVTNIEDGTPVQGATVAWPVSGGAVASNSTRTDADGYTSNTWSLGPNTGRYTLTATAVGPSGEAVAGSASFIATANNRTLYLTQTAQRFGYVFQDRDMYFIEFQVIDDGGQGVPGVYVSVDLDDVGAQLYPDVPGSSTSLNITSDGSGGGLPGWWAAGWHRGSDSPGTVTVGVMVNGDHISGSPYTFTVN